VPTPVSFAGQSERENAESSQAIRSSARRSSGEESS